MPFCEDCDRFYNPNTLRPDGTCPSCGRVLGDPGDADATAAAAGAPWHFKVLVAITVVYLAWRLLEGLAWVAQQL